MVKNLLISFVVGAMIGASAWTISQFVISKYNLSDKGALYVKFGIFGVAAILMMLFVGLNR